jgi:hypothetical protein
MMREFVTFSSKAFSKAAMPHHINPVCRCDDLAAWLESRLDEAIPGARTTRYQEDFGWVVEVGLTQLPKPFMVVAGNLDEDDEETDAFGVYVEAPQRASPDDVIAAIDRALHEDPAIESIQWWDGGFMGGEPTDHADGTTRRS